MRKLSRIALALVSLLVTACGGAEVRDGYDEMVFAEDSAIESIPTWRQPRRPRRVATAGASLPRADGWATPFCDEPREGYARSLGMANDGQLENPCRIPASGPGYVAVNRRSSYGTDETIAYLQSAAAVLAHQYPGTPPVVIGAVSAPSGGTLRPHKSHQSGRDVDVGYLHSDLKALRRFWLTDSGNLDVERTWTFLENLLYTGEVVFVFMDYNLQAVFYAELRDAGWSEDRLSGLFQYPAGPHVPRGIIRHASGHADHFHVRFRCAQRDKPDCVD